MSRKAEHAMSGRNHTPPVDPYNIVEFGTYHIAMNLPAHAHIRAYWDELRSGRMMPLRSEVDPREMAPYLEHCFVLQRTGPADTRFRLAGMALNEILGMELRGMPLRSIIQPEGRALFSAQLEQVFTTPEIQEYQLVSEGPHMPRLTGRLLVLPLKGDEAQADRAIGCLTTEGIYGLPPRRFQVKEVTRTSLVTGESRKTVPSLQDFPETKTPAPAPAGFAEAQAPFTTETSVPYLRVVK